MSEHAGISRSFLTLALLEIAARGVCFAANVLLVRHYGGDGFGRIALAQSLVGFGLICAGGGLDVYAVRAVAADRSRLRGIGATTVLLRVLLAIAALVVLCGVVAAVPGWRETLPLVNLFGVTLLTGGLSLVWVARATERFWIVGLAGLLQPVLFVGCWWCTRWFLPGLLSVPAAAIASELVLAAGLFVWARPLIGRLEMPSAWSQVRELLRGAAPIGASQLLRVVALGSDLVLIGLLLSFQHVGLYAAAYRIFTVGLSLATAYFVVLLPRLARAAAKSPAALGSELRGSLGRTIPATLVAAGVGVLAAGELLAWLFGPAFWEAQTAMQLLAFTGAVFVLNGHTRTTLIASGRQRQNMVHIAAGAVVHVIAKSALIPLLGITGAAAGTLLGETVLLLLGWQAARGLLQTSQQGRAAAAERMQREPSLAAN